MEISSVRWKHNFTPKSIDPEKAYSALEALRERNDGDLTDDAILGAAKARNHVLHKWFEWDDSKAAHEHRRQQARKLLRSFEVTYKEAPETPVRAFEIHRQTQPGSVTRTAYRTTDEVLADDKSRDKLIASAIRMAMEFRRRFKGISELDRIVEAIDKTVEAVGSRD